MAAKLNERFQKITFAVWMKMVNKPISNSAFGGIAEVLFPSLIFR